jgi:hypothetical protein
MWFFGSAQTDFEIDAVALIRLDISCEITPPGHYRGNIPGDIPGIHKIFQMQHPISTSQIVKYTERKECRQISDRLPEFRKQ